MIELRAALTLPLMVAIALGGACSGRDDTAVPAGDAPAPAAATAPAPTFGISFGGAGEPDARGGEIYARVCAQCHAGGGLTRAPAYSSLSGMSPRAIVNALEGGVMKAQGAALSADERHAVAEWLTGRAWTQSVLPASAYCVQSVGETAATPAVRWSGWGGDDAGTGARTTAQAGFTAAEVPQLRLQWAFAFPDAVQVRSKPAIIGDRLIVGSQDGTVYALAVDSGCIAWTFQAKASVRSGIVIGTDDGAPRAFFVDFRSNVYALDTAAGTLLWQQRAGDHAEASNTGTPALHAGYLYVPLSTMEGATAMNPAHPCCTTSGEVVALATSDGAVQWRHAVVGEAQQVGENSAGTPLYAPSGAPVWSSPTVDAARGRLYVGTGENYTRPTTDTSDAVLALDLATGDLLWSHQGHAGDAWNLACGSPHPENCPDDFGPDFDFGMAPMLLTRRDGSQILVAGEKSGVVWALDPARNGAVLWSQKIGKGGTLGGVHWGMASDGRLAYVGVSDSPAGMQGIEPDFPPSPGVYALDLMEGHVVWHAAAAAAACAGRDGCVAAHSAATTIMPGVVFSGSLDGHIRAYAADDGRVLWDYDTVRDYDTVNGLPGHGGALDGPGPVVADGRLFVNSGYGLFGQMPGNVLLAFVVAANH